MSLVYAYFVIYKSFPYFPETLSFLFPKINENFINFVLL